MKGDPVSVTEKDAEPLDLPEAEPADATEAEETTESEEATEAEEVEESVAADEVEESAEPEESEESAEPAAVDAGGRVRRWAVPVLALVLALAGVVVLMTRSGGGSSDRAVTDAGATARVSGDVSDIISRIFTYRYADAAATQKQADSALTGQAADQYRTLFQQVLQQAPGQRLSLTTRVVRTGVIHLTGSTAQLLVFLDQSASRAGKPAGTAAAAQLLVTARLDGDGWRISELHAV